MRVGSHIIVLMRRYGAARILRRIKELHGVADGLRQRTGHCDGISVARDAAAVVHLSHALVGHENNARHAAVAGVGADREMPVRFRAGEMPGTSVALALQRNRDGVGIQLGVDADRPRNIRAEKPIGRIARRPDHHRLRGVHPAEIRRVHRRDRICIAVRIIQRHDAESGFGHRRIQNPSPVTDRVEIALRGTVGQPAEHHGLIEILPSVGEIGVRRAKVGLPVQLVAHLLRFLRIMGKVVVHGVHERSCLRICLILRIAGHLGKAGDIADRVDDRKRIGAGLVADFSRLVRRSFAVWRHGEGFIFIRLIFILRHVVCDFFPGMQRRIRTNVRRQRRGRERAEHQHREQERKQSLFHADTPF